MENFFQNKLPSTPNKVKTINYELKNLQNERSNYKQNLKLNQITLTSLNQERDKVKICKFEKNQQNKANDVIDQSQCQNQLKDNNLIKNKTEQYKYISTNDNSRSNKDNYDQLYNITDYIVSKKNLLNDFNNVSRVSNNDSQKDQPFLENIMKMQYSLQDINMYKSR